MDKDVEIYNQWNINQPLKKEGNPALTTTWINLEDNMQRGISQLQKDKYSLIPFI